MGFDIRSSKTQGVDEHQHPRKLQHQYPHQCKIQADTSDMDKGIIESHCPWDTTIAHRIGPKNNPLVQSSPSKTTNIHTKHPNIGNHVRELVIVGAGPHALALVLRLIEPQADLLSDQERHRNAEFAHRMRPIADVKKHIQHLQRGPKAVLASTTHRRTTSRDRCPSSTNASLPPPVSIHFLRTQCFVMDSHASQKWMATWKDNFERLQIPHLRSPLNAHCDPFDHRALEVYANYHRRNHDIVSLDHMAKQTGRWTFHGPYSAPSTALFQDFHDQLVHGYGIGDLVQATTVTQVRVQPPFATTTSSTTNTDHDQQDPIFVLSVRDPSGQASIVRTRRLVCALGPALSKTHENLLAWERPLQEYLASRTSIPKYSELVLRTDQILTWLGQRSSAQGDLTHPPPTLKDTPKRILIVGGGITSGHMGLIACRSPSWCSSVTLIQRSRMKEQQFDVDPDWMGPARGKLQQEFRDLSPIDRMERIKEVRGGGGSLSPEVVRLLCQQQQRRKEKRLMMRECVEIESVRVLADNALSVLLDDGTVWEGDMIWIATGFDNDLDNHPILGQLARDLPIANINGLPVLNSDLSWGTEADDQTTTGSWKDKARKRCWVMGAMAGLELGPDALNLLGARQGAVRVAMALREDLHSCANAQ